MTRSKQVVDLSELLKGHEGEWVIISGDKSRVLCSDKSLDEVLKKAKQYDNRVLLRVPDEHTAVLL